VQDGAQTRVLFIHTSRRVTHVLVNATSSAPPAEMKGKMKIKAFINSDTKAPSDSRELEVAQKAQVQFQISKCEICGSKVALEEGFLLVFSFAPPTYIPKNSPSLKCVTLSNSQHITTTSVIS
jgi:hypothetical protein